VRIYLTAVMVVGTELKNINSVRIQIKLEERSGAFEGAQGALQEPQINRI